MREVKAGILSLGNGIRELPQPEPAHHVTIYPYLPRARVTTTSARSYMQLLANVARDEKRLLRLQRQLAAYKLLIVDELGYVPLSQTGAELLFEVFSQRYERGSTIVTSNLPFDEWTSVFGAERLTGALLDRLTHHVHILEMNGDSYRLAHSKRRSRRPRADAAPEATAPD